MNKRRTLDLPDAPGVWLFRDKKGYVEQCYVWHDESMGWLFDRLYEQETFVVANYIGLQWQGPVQWEDNNATNA